MIIIVSDKNLIIMGGAALLIIIFVMYVIGENNRAKLKFQATNSQQPTEQTMQKEPAYR